MSLFFFRTLLLPLNGVEDIVELSVLIEPEHGQRKSLGG